MIGNWILLETVNQERSSLFKCKKNKNGEIKTKRKS